MVVEKLSKSKTVAAMQTLSTGTQFPLATSSGVMSSSNAASLEDGQNNRTKPALDVRTYQRTHSGTSKKDVAYSSNSHSHPHQTSAGTSVDIETKEEDKWGGSKKADTMNFFHNVHEHERFVKSLNATFITLIMKKLGQLEARDFRPISLIGSTYKILAKVLVNRLQPIVGNLISNSHNTFNGGRQILDSVLIANKYLDSRLRSGIPGVLCKLDLDKAFDHVNWDFLFYILRCTRFGPKWRKWI